MANTAESPALKKPRKPAAKKAPAGSTPAKPRKKAAPKASTASSTTATVKNAVTKAAAAASAAATAAGARITESVESVDWKAQAEQLKTQAGKVARDAADAAKDKTGSAMQSLSKLIADTADTVDSKLGPQYGDYARSAAQAVAGAAKSVDEADIDQLIEEARTFVRKSPAVAIGAAAIAGFVLMRLAKGSSDEGDTETPEDVTSPEDLAS